MVQTKLIENEAPIQTILGKDAEGAICYSKHGLCKNTGIHEWSFKCELSSDSDMIGIVSSLDKIKETQRAQHLAGIAYFWWSGYGVWRNRPKVPE